MAVMELVAQFGQNLFKSATIWYQWKNLVKENKWQTKFIYRIGAGGKHYMALPVETSDLVMEGPSQTNTSRELLDRTQARGLGFTEMQSYWTIPFHDSAVVNSD